MEKKQPGSMLYFDIRPCLKRLTLEEKGQLFEAILDYGEFGVPPELDGVAGVAWDFIQPRLDRDKERYQDVSQKRAEAANVRWERERKMQMHANEYTRMQAMPTSTPTSPTTPYSPSVSASETEETPELSFEELRARRIQAVTKWGG